MEHEPPSRDKTDGDIEVAAQVKRKRRLEEEKKTIERMYCPCPGFAYNSLAGEKNVLVSFEIPQTSVQDRQADMQCKHLLAALIGWKTGREIETEVPQHGVVSLLDLHDQTQDVYVDTDAAVKTEQAD